VQKWFSVGNFFVTENSAKIKKLNTDWCRNLSSDSQRFFCGGEISPLGDKKRKGASMTSTKEFLGK
jgi:hypothetical protein